jgi:hypothetical protein
VNPTTAQPFLYRAINLVLSSSRGGSNGNFFVFRAEEVGYVVPTEVQEQSLPLLLSGQDCILHAQVVLSSISLRFLPKCFRYQEFMF